MQAMQYRNLALKAETYREMLAFREQSPMKLLSAEVVGKTTIQMRNYATLFVGSCSGVREGLAVITERGLAGRVIGVNDDYSVVQLLLNRDTRVTARTLEARNEGMITWDGAGSLILGNVPAAQPQRKGDTVVTSSLSALYPENIPVGVIDTVADDPGTLFYRIRVRPMVNFATLEEAFVVLYTPDQKRLELERKLIEPNQSEEGKRR